MLAKEMLSPYVRLAKLELDIAPVSLGGFRLFSTGSRFGEVRRRRQSLFLGGGIALLCKAPPFWRGFSLSGVDSGRVLGFRARSGLRRTSGFTSRQEGFAMQLRGRLPDSRSGLITGDFANRNAPIPPLCREKKIAKWVIFSRIHLLSEPDLRLFL